jgi:pSer/pThr/pTyr-binding forkhead associated (FHA) protein
MAYLQIIKGAKSGARAEIKREIFSIGRAPDNDLVLDDPAVSTHHCTILRAGGEYRLRDLDSTNGTVLNGQRVQETALSAGDVIAAGSAQIRFDEEPAVPAEPAEPRAQVAAAPSAPRLAGLPPAFGARRRTGRFGAAALAIAAGLMLLTALWFLLRLLQG